MGFNGLVECVDNDRAGDPSVNRHMQPVSGVIIEPADGFGIGPIGKPDVGEV